MTFQVRLILAALSTTILALLVALTLFAVTMRSRVDGQIEGTLVAEARLASELLGHGTSAGGAGSHPRCDNRRARRQTIAGGVS